MSKIDTIILKMKTIEADLRRHQRLYYIQNQPEISDQEFDKLFTSLQNLEKENPELISPDSPTRSIGSDLDNAFEKVTHLVPVLSLSNTYSPQEALVWSQKSLEHKKNKLVIQWKIDGATLVLYYKSGRLARAVTRGSGQVGDDVTANALTIVNVPHVLSEPVDVVVRGEVYMTFDGFQKFNEEYGSIYANPRNLTSGSLKHKKSKEVAKRPLLWAAFEAHFIDTTEILPEGFKTYTTTNKKQVSFKLDSEVLVYLKKLALPVACDTLLVDGSGVETAIETFTKLKKNVSFPVDGLVLKLDDLVDREKSGFTAHSPRWATSLKFEPEVAQTHILDIEFFTGRTGRVTPRARLEPVALGGTTVSYATLHNEDYINKLGVRVGALVKVSKRGEIIPAVEEVVDPGKGPKLKFPKKCPSCKSKLIREEGAADWVCNNSNCDTKRLERIIFFCQRKQMDIAGMGERTCTALYKEGLVVSISDIYQLKNHKETLESLEGFGEKSASIILDGIEESKKKPYRQLLPSLGLREVGARTSEILIESDILSIDALIKVVQKKDAQEQLQIFDGIGPRTADLIVEQLSRPEVLELINSLKKSGLCFEQKEATEEGSILKQIFNNQSWCVTGSFDFFSPRDLAKVEIKKRGGRVVSTVSAKTTHLLAGQKAGSKLTKAQDLDVQVVLEQEFLKLID